MDIIETLERFTKLSIKKQIAIGLEDTQDDLVQAQKDQMLHGEAATKGIIGKYKNPYYKRKKQAMNPLAKGNVDLKLTGAFQGQIVALVDDSSVNILSVDEKTDKLLEKYGENKVFGLNEERAAKYSNDVLAPVVINRIENIFYYGL